MNSLLHCSNKNAIWGFSLRNTKNISAVKKESSFWNEKQKGPQHMPCTFTRSSLVGKPITVLLSWSPWFHWNRGDLRVCCLLSCSVWRNGRTLPHLISPQQVHAWLMQPFIFIPMLWRLYAQTGCFWFVLADQPSRWRTLWSWKSWCNGPGTMIMNIRKETSVADGLASGFLAERCADDDYSDGIWWKREVMVGLILKSRGLQSFAFDRESCHMLSGKMDHTILKGIIIYLITKYHISPQISRASKWITERATFFSIPLYLCIVT